MLVDGSGCYFYPSDGRSDLKTWRYLSSGSWILCLAEFFWPARPSVLVLVDTFGSATCSVKDSLMVKSVGPLVVVTITSSSLVPQLVVWWDYSSSALRAFTSYSGRASRL